MFYIDEPQNLNQNIPLIQIAEWPKELARLRHLVHDAKGDLNEQQYDDKKAAAGDATHKLAQVNATQMKLRCVYEINRLRLAFAVKEASKRLEQDEAATVNTQVPSSAPNNEAAEFAASKLSTGSVYNPKPWIDIVVRYQRNQEWTKKYQYREVLRHEISKSNQELLEDCTNGQGRASLKGMYADLRDAKPNLFGIDFEKISGDGYLSIRTYDLNIDGLQIEQFMLMLRENSGYGTPDCPSLQQSYQRYLSATSALNENNYQMQRAHAALVGDSVKVLEIDEAQADRYSEYVVSILQGILHKSRFEGDLACLGKLVERLMLLLETENLDEDTSLAVMANCILGQAYMNALYIPLLRTPTLSELLRTPRGAEAIAAFKAKLIAASKENVRR